MIPTLQEILSGKVDHLTKCKRCRHYVKGFTPNKPDDELVDINKHIILCDMCYSIISTPYTPRKW